MQDRPYPFGRDRLERLQLVRASSECDAKAARLPERGRLLRRLLQRDGVRVSRANRRSSNVETSQLACRSTTQRAAPFHPPRCPVRGRSSRLEQNFASLLVRQHLPLDALQRVVDRLRVAAELGCHLLVRRALEIQPQRVRLELRQARSQGEDEALQLLRRD